jgi:hypothetical protein
VVRRQEVVIVWWQTSHVGSPVNEWADVLADEYKSADVVAVPRGPVEFASWQWTGAPRSTFAWARERASKVQLQWYASFAEETPIRKGNELKLRSVPPQVGLWAERVLTARVFAGDPRMRRELGEWCRDEDVACPHGCCSDKGPVVLTWWHAAFCCKCEEAVARRDAWQAEVIAA